MLKKTLPDNSLAEIFGYAPYDSSKDARLLWKTGTCPFTLTTCSKINHNSGIIYGTCTAKTADRTVIICPNRLYANKYACIHKVAKDAFGKIPMIMFKEYWENRTKLSNQEVIVALGHNSGREVKLGTKLSMDWVLARVKKGQLEEYIGVEVQSIDITGNYRDNWHYFSEQKYRSKRNVPPSENGYNWANVHKRLIPQIIRKGLIYGNSKLVNHGIYFILPDIVFCKFEEVVGKLKKTTRPTKEVMTVHTYELGNYVPEGCVRPLRHIRTIQFLAKDFANAFISGVNLPSGAVLDGCIKKMLGVA